MPTNAKHGARALGISAKTEAALFMPSRKLGSGVALKVSPVGLRPQSRVDAHFH